MTDEDNSDRVDCDEYLHNNSHTHWIDILYLILLFSQLNDRLNTVAEDTRINEENVKMIDSLLRQAQDKLGAYEMD